MNAAWNWCAQGASWCIRHNPTYLMSAACMAAGAKLYLGNPGTVAGDIGVILGTLGVLQLYEWAVMGILIALRRSRRAPEDELSLAIVAALFWTGPIAATVEMTARQPRLGLLLACGVVVFALAELVLAKRALLPRLGPRGVILAGACLALLAIAPSQLRPDQFGEANDPLLYFCWWLLGGLILGALPITRRHEADVRSRTNSDYELGFLLIVFASTATHLVGANYAFLGHARWFYCGPVLLAAAFVGFHGAGAARRGDRLLSVASALLPLIAAILALEPFHPEFPTERLPAPLRDPLLTLLPVAAAAWWYGAARTRAVALIHLGSAALALALARACLAVTAGSAPHPPVVPHAFDGRTMLTMAAITATVYFAASAAIRRSRGEALAALVLLQAAVAALAAGRLDADRVLIAACAGWSLLAAAHLSSTTPSLAALLLPAAGLTAIGWYCELDPVLRWPGRLNSLVLVALLLRRGWHPPRPASWWVGLALLLANASTAAGRLVFHAGQPSAMAAVMAAFALLAVGGWVSWRKQALLRFGRASAVEPPPPYSA